MTCNAFAAGGVVRTGDTQPSLHLADDGYWEGDRYYSSNDRYGNGQYGDNRYGDNSNYDNNRHANGRYYRRHNRQADYQRTGAN